MIDLLDLPALAIEVLRQHMRMRAEQGLPVSWYSGGCLHTVEPSPDKSEGSWSVTSGKWQGYYRKDHVLTEIAAASTFEYLV